MTKLIPALLFQGLDVLFKIFLSTFSIMCFLLDGYFVVDRGCPCPGLVPVVTGKIKYDKSEKSQHEI